MQTNQRAAGLIAALILASAAAAQNTWFVRGSGGAAAHVVGTEIVRVHDVAAEPFATGDGSFAVHFGADAAGKPGTLRLADVRGSQVQIAVATAAPAAATFTPLNAPAWSDHVIAQGLARLLSPDGEANVRIEATLADQGDAAVLGLVARAQPDGGHYRYEWDREQREHRLVRRMGEHELVLARASAAAHATPARLALQVDGFRLQACCDDVVVLQVFDGGFQEGAVGTWQRGGGGEWQTFSTQPPAAPRASAALLRGVDSATLHAFVPATPGSFSVLELRLDRPHALVPATAAGELWLLQPAVAPIVAIGDWRASLGPSAIGEVDRDGHVQATVTLPRLPTLRGQACLLRALIVDQGGEAITGATPFVPLWWPSVGG